MQRVSHQIVAVDEPVSHAEAHGIDIPPCNAVRDAVNDMRPASLPHEIQRKKVRMVINILFVPRMNTVSKNHQRQTRCCRIRPCVPNCLKLVAINCVRFVWHGNTGKELLPRAEPRGCNRATPRLRGQKTNARTISLSPAWAGDCTSKALGFSPGAFLFITGKVQKVAAFFLDRRSAPLLYF